MPFVPDKKSSFVPDSPSEMAPDDSFKFKDFKHKVDEELRSGDFLSQGYIGGPAVGMLGKGLGALKDKVPKAMTAVAGAFVPKSIKVLAGLLPSRVAPQAERELLSEASTGSRAMPELVDIKGTRRFLPQEAWQPRVELGSTPHFDPSTATKLAPGGFTPAEVAQPAAYTASEAQELASNPDTLSALESLLKSPRQASATLESLIATPKGVPPEVARIGKPANFPKRSMPVSEVPPYEPGEALMDYIKRINETPLPGESTIFKAKPLSRTKK